MKSAKWTNKLNRLMAASIVGLLSLGTVHSVHAINLHQSPLFLAQPVLPIMMLNLSVDHQLFFKAYDDYSDLDGDKPGGDPEPETTYTNSVDYYGYFDSDKCYTHSGSHFVEFGEASDHKCSGQWSGNFLNWATMTRMDAVRKILYGGKRSKDDSSTILERAFLPQDAHSFAKYYNGSDISELVPSTHIGSGGIDENTLVNRSGITICNTSDATSGQSQDKTDSEPLMRIVKGNYSLWASNERWQCKTREEISASSVSGGDNGKNGNNIASSKIPAYGNSPKDEWVTDLEVKVEVCKEANYAKGCKAYNNGSVKPFGLLQEYGETEQIRFGLMTGSYLKNKSGGVLRKPAGYMTDEIDLETGRFKESTSGYSIIDTLDSLRISRYKHGDGLYNGSDKCAYGKNSFVNGSCTNWGNPQSEIYLESLRYLAGLQPEFSADDSDIGGVFSDLKEVTTWVDPVEAGSYCAPLSVMQFNASTSSYDHDEVDTLFAGISNGESIATLLQTIGSSEGINNTSRYVGSVGSATDSGDGLCTAKSITSLNNVTGTCPDAPRLGGSYKIAALAYHANLNGVKSGRETVRTFGVALAPAVPLVNIPVSGGVVRLQPACQNKSIGGNCAIVDFKIVAQNHGASNSSGLLYVNWEDSEQGGDFDQDMWGTIAYEVVGSAVKITTDSIAQSTPNKMGFGYVIGGTTNDGFHAHSGINGYNETISSGERCDNCNVGDSASTKDFTVSAGAGANALQQPLYYASRWGGFDTVDKEGNAVLAPSGEETPSYFYATDPGTLAEDVREALETAIEGAGAATAVATNSTRLDGESVAYQATFDASSWFGDLVAAKLGEQTLADPIWSAANKLPSPSARKIWTHDGSKPVEFEWSNLSEDQQKVLNGGDESDGKGADRVAWTRGQSIEGMRRREDGQLLGDIVNSSPKLAGDQDYGYGRSSASGGGAPYDTFVKTKTDKTVFVGANDGMLHAFNAETGVERFAYIPSTVYEQLKIRSDENYGTSFNPHQYSVDGQIFVGDAYINGSWKTILVGTLGAGGKGIFALDVTNPSGFDADNVLFEYNAANQPEIGNIIGTPIIAPMPNGSWAIVSGNGYNSNSGKAQLLIIPLDGSYTPTFIDTGIGGDNGLSEPALSVGGGFLAQYAYAGDLKGNMHKFDLSSKSYSYNLFTAQNNQAITAAPVLGVNPYPIGGGEPATMVYFGTGSYLAKTDLDDTNPQSFYGIKDIGSEVSTDDLFEKEITAQSTSGRQVLEGDKGPENKELDWGKWNGWFLNFDQDLGERVVDKPILFFDRLIFPTVIPTENPCDFGGRSWIMALIGVGGLYNSYSPFEPEVPEGSDPPSDNPVEGVPDDTLIKLSTPTKGGPPCDGGSFIIQQNSDGTVSFVCTGEPDVVKGRQSWRQLQ